MFEEWTSLIGKFVIAVVLIRLIWWAYLVLFKSVNLSAYKSNNPTWAVITGASDGIGLGFAKVLAGQGFNLVLIGRNQEKLQGVAESIIQRWGGIKCKVVVSEASDLSPGNFDNVCKQVESLDVSLLVNNVGVTHGPKVVHELVPEKIERLVNVNCTYPLLLTNKLMPLILKHSGRKAVLNISSMTAYYPPPFLSIYSASKAFNRNFSLAMAADYSALGVDVLAVSPGYVASQMTKMKESLICSSPEDCAERSLAHLGWSIECVPHFKHSLVGFTGTVFYALIPQIILSKLFGFAATRAKTALYPKPGPKQ
jgi:17beta-estradiol 17-dehydrogenase / very-long-chain 3-oxoacyl-CoA reductase